MLSVLIGLRLVLPAVVPVVASKIQFEEYRDALGPWLNWSSPVQMEEGQIITDEFSAGAVQRWTADYVRRRIPPKPAVFSSSMIRLTMHVDDMALVAAVPVSATAEECLEEGISLASRFDMRTGGGCVNDINCVGAKIADALLVRGADCGGHRLNRNDTHRGGVPTFKTRAELSCILECQGYQRGVELGVFRGDFSRELLSCWRSAKTFVMVDLWQKIDNYQDAWNTQTLADDEFIHESLDNVDALRRAHGTDIIICRNFTLECANNFPDHYFDFIYLDAQHDFKSVASDLTAWWPKLRPGGIFSGHDYVTQDDGPAQLGSDWTTAPDGSIDHTGLAVKGAVDAFARSLGLQLTIAYREPLWNSWALRKPELA